MSAKPAKYFRRPRRNEFLTAEHAATITFAEFASAVLVCREHEAVLLLHGEVVRPLEVTHLAS